VTTATFGPYDIEELVADGPNMTVWRARHTDLKRLVAIKTLSPDRSPDPAALAQLRSEARMLTRLDNPHIVAVYDFVEDAEPPYLVTEWVDGQTVREMLGVVGRLSPEQSLGVLRGALQGLAYAHDRGLLHGDVSSSNLVVDTSGTTKLVDFGLAAPTGERGVSGTPAYLSPEAASGHPLSPASDVYSAAALLFELLSGAPPFAGQDALATIRAHREDPPPPLAGHGPELASLLERALAKDPSQRPADAGAFLGELEDAAQARYGPAWLSSASVAGLAGLGAAGGAAATVAGATSAGSAAGAAGGTGAVDAMATATATATAETGGAPSAAAGALQQGRRAGGIRHAIGAHPVIAGGLGVVVVAAAVTIPVVAASGNSKPKPSPQAVLLASSPLGAFSAKGSITASTSSSQKLGKVGTFPWTVTETCTATSCAAVVKAPGSTFHFTYTGDVFNSHSINKFRVQCEDKKTHKVVAGSTALEHHDLMWSLRVIKRAPSTPDGPGRALALSGTVVETNSYSDFTKQCEDIGVIKTTYAYSVTRK
jgi:eukaryotic-like serine/threonine-protein kinase